LGIIIFLIVLSFLVFFHELGHFSAAKFFKVKVLTFSIGFGKKIYSFNWLNTDWQISLIPLGGYVKMKGQDDTKPNLVDNSDDSYNTRAPWQRIIILLAGPFFNFLLAGILYFFIAIIGVNALSPTIGTIVPNSAAFKNNLQKNDKIIQINNTKIKTWTKLAELITTSKGALSVYFLRDEKVYKKIISPKIKKSKNIFGEDIQKRLLGISPKFKIIKVHYNFFPAIKYGYDQTIKASKLIFQGVIKLIEGVVPSRQIGGVISIAKIISSASQNGIVALFTVIALVSVNLGVLNLLPIPALDGGHIIFNIYEIIARRKASDKVFMFLTICGWIILVFLMLLGFYNDITRFF